MDKKQIINEIMDLYDENRYLNHKVEVLVERLNKAENPDGAIDGDASEGHSSMDKRAFVTIAKKAIFSKYFYTYQSTGIERDDDGALRCTSYEDWKRICIQDIPEEMSKNQFLEFMDDFLRDIYEQRLEKEKKKFLEDEKEDSEDDQE